MRTMLTAFFAFLLGLVCLRAGLADDPAGKGDNGSGPDKGESKKRAKVMGVGTLPPLPPNTLPPVVLPFDPAATMPFRILTVQNPERAVPVLKSPGTIVPAHLVRVTPGVPGQVREVLVEAGAAVKAGQVLARLDPTVYELEYRAALALVARAQARVAQEESNKEAQTAAVREAEAAVKEAAAHRDYLKRKAERMRALQQSAAITESLVQEAESQLAAAEARVQQTTAACRLVQTKLNTGRLEAAKAELAYAETRRELAKARLDRASIRAPASGTVLARRVDVGDSVRPDAMVNGRSVGLFEIADLAHVEVAVEVAEKDLTRIAPGQACEVRFDASTAHKVYRGQVARVQPTISQRTRTATVRVRLEVPPADSTVRPGMSAVVQFGARE